jgi:undecaprenyl-diphosphatase
MTTATDLLLQTDRDLFLFLNGLHSEWLDVVMYWVTYKFTWIPLYTVLIVLTIRSEKKKSVAIIISVLVAVAIADKITSGVMKPYFMRLRPCHDPSLFGIIHQVGDCGGMFGFASSHASTSFALAVVWFTLLKDRLRNMYLLLIWAAIYSYSRVYVGVHYPGDILVGAMVGIATGLVVVQLYYTFLKKYYYN